MFHISDIKKFLRCEKYYFLNKDINNSFFPYLRSNQSINELLIDYFNIKDKCFIGVKNDKTDRFFSEKDNYEWFSYPRFSDGELRINIPFMHKIDDSYDLYFIYHGTLIKELDLITYRISCQILIKLGLSINNIFLIHLNENYVNDGVLNTKNLFIVTNTFNNRLIKDIIFEKEFDYISIINSMTLYDVNTDCHKNKYCKQNGICEYYKTCFPNEERIEKDSVLSLVSSKNKNQMFEEGIRLLKDVDLDRIEGNRIQYAQIMASRNNGIFIDEPVLRYWLNTINNEVVSYIDFEWDRYLIPPYANMKPMDPLCFEYALYYKNGNSALEHKTYVGIDDCRREFIENLINDLPKDGPILAYNADGAEKIRLEELGRVFPEYSNELNNIKNRFVDLAIPFIEGFVYDIRMEGNFSMKKLIEIVSDYSYKNLEIDDGLNAVRYWRSLDGVSCDRDKIINDLKKYCSLDAYGLFLLHDWLNNLLN